MKYILVALLSFAGIARADFARYNSIEVTNLEKRTVTITKIEYHYDGLVTLEQPEAPFIVLAPGQTHIMQLPHNKLKKVWAWGAGSAWKFSVASRLYSPLTCRVKDSTMTLELTADRNSAILLETDKGPQVENGKLACEEVIPKKLSPYFGCEGGVPGNGFRVTFYGMANEPFGGKLIGLGADSMYEIGELSCESPQ